MIKYGIYYFIFIYGTYSINKQSELLQFLGSYSAGQF